MAGSRKSWVSKSSPNQLEKENKIDNKILNDNRLLNKKKAAFVGESLKGANFAAVFDMDGTLVDNTPFHYKAWQLLFEKHNMPELSRETYKAEISGVPILNTIQKYFPNAGKAEQDLLVDQKQQLYQQQYLPFLRPINGLENFLRELSQSGIKVALATSSEMADVDFIFDKIPIRQYFDTIVIGSMVNQPKPSPQIFLKAAEQLNTPPGKCVVFEDSMAGLQAGNNAGMKVVGITTAHPASVINKIAGLAINDYADIDIHQLAALFND
ncbi:hypothetical protein A0256_24365 [Mucilaginibacter sp. PAMC 26640]|nr:hypothetical protein A0256_24365 [Mucilaginibacter sp. PAMC 26640]